LGHHSVHRLSIDLALILKDFFYLFCSGTFVIPREIVHGTVRESTREKSTRRDIVQVITTAIPPTQHAYVD
jgi:hypothetical protein